VLPAISFDDEALPQANKVSNEAVDRNLPLELKAGKPLGPQDLPKAAFRFGRLASRGSGT
jgi:hypothetical protein